MERELKSCAAVATKVLDQERGIVEHIVAVMGNIDRGGDVIHPGAFGKTLMERGLQVKVLDQHNAGSVCNIVGKPLGLREVGRLELPPELLARYPDATGALVAQTQFLLDTPEGRGVFDRIKARAVDEYSIGYDPIVTDYTTLETPDGKKAVRNLREVRLWEYSPVVFGMNPATRTLSAKGTGEPAESKPDPGAYESEADWMAACIPARIEEGNEQDQAVATCLSMWREKTADSGDDEDEDEDEDEEKRKRRRRKKPLGTAMPVGDRAPVVALNSADGPEDEKAGRRLRRDRLEQARQACKVLSEFLSWADYDEVEAPATEQAADDTDRGAHKAAGPDTPPTAQQQKALVEHLQLELQQLEVEL